MAQFLLDMAYYREYGLDAGLTKEDKENPLYMVLMRPAVVHQPETPMKTLLRHFVKTRVGEHFKISLAEFLDLPEYLCNEMLDIAAEETQRDGKSVAKHLDALNERAGLGKG